MDHSPVPWHERVGHWQDQMCLHAVKSGTFNRYPAIARLSDHVGPYRIDGPGSGNNTQFEVYDPFLCSCVCQCRSQKLLPGGSIDAFERGQISQQVSDFASVVGCAKHHDPSKFGRSMSSDKRSGHKATHRMPDKVNRELSLVQIAP